MLCCWDPHKAGVSAGQEAVMLGIPRKALPQIPDSASLEEYRGLQTRLSGMIASFMSSSL